MLSWIWLTGNVGACQDNEGDELLQIEWAKSRACATRTAKEVLLLWEEMCRVIEFLKWKSKWWVSRVVCPSEDEGLVEGLCAYAYKQALLQKSLSQLFQTIWKTPLEEWSINQPTAGIDGIADNSDGEEDADCRKNNANGDDTFWI